MVLVVPCGIALAIVMTGALTRSAPVAPAARIQPSRLLRVRQGPPRVRWVARLAHRRTHPVTLGAAIDTRVFGEAAYRRTLLEHYSGITPSYQMKWDAVEPSDGRFTFGAADALVRFARAHGMTVHGHNLVWGDYLPKWLLDRRWTRHELEAVLRRHVTVEVSHFRGRVSEWDVVNEPLTLTGAYVPSLWERVIGPGYIADALRWAHAADPAAKLMINDTRLDFPGVKQRAMVALIRRLKAEHVPIDGVGIEAHVSLAAAPTKRQLVRAMRSYAAEGMFVEITEADVDTTGFRGSSARRDARQAAIFRALAGACHAVRACTRFTVWGVADSDSDLGPAARALPFTSAYRPTESWWAIRAGLLGRSRHGRRR